MQTYNKYITEGVQDGSIKANEYEGVRWYTVRPPYSGEEVVGYTNFSGIFGERTPTQEASG